MSSDDKDIRLTRDEVVIPHTDVTIYQALYGRRMAWQFKEDPVPRELVQRMLDTAVWAPNHRLTEPWRFFVLEKESPVRQKVADLAYEFVLQQRNNPTRAQAGREKVLAPPILMYVYSVPGPDEEVTQENYAAVCCAAHNISLAGVAEGLAVTWETGGVTRPPELKETLGAEEDWKLVVMLSIGFPAERPNPKRTPVSNVSRWFE